MQIRPAMPATPQAPPAAPTTPLRLKDSVVLSERLRPYRPYVPPRGLRDPHAGLRRAAAAAAAALSVTTTALSAGPAAAAIPMLDQGPRVELVAARACLAPPASATPAAVRAWKNQVADRMLERGRPVAEETRRKVREEAALIPPEILGVLERNGTGIVVLRRGETPLDAGVVREVDVKADFGDLGALKDEVDGALRASDREYGTPISALERELEPLLRETAGPEPNAAAVVRRDDLNARLRALREARNADFYRRVLERTGGRVEPHEVILPEEAESFGLALGGLLSRAPVTLDDLAELHGAQTPEERALIMDLVRSLNGNRLREAQSRFARLPQDMRSQEPPSDGLEENKRPFSALQDRIVVPALYFVRKASRPDAPPRLLSGHDALSMGIWKSDMTRGQYYGAGDRNTVVVREEDLGTRAGGRSVLVHEMGHAFEDAMQEMDTEAYERYAVQRDGSFRRMAKSGGFVSDYAGSSPAEMAADTFGYLFSGDAASVQRSDRVWSEQFGDLLQRGRGLGASCFDVASPGAPSKAGAALTLDGAPVYQRGVASWYGPGFHGRPTASGQRFNRYGMTAAHPSLPLGSRITVVNLGNGRSVDVVVNDRGPFVGGRVLDLSEGAAEQLGFKRAGTARVEIRFRF